MFDCFAAVTEDLLSAGHDVSDGGLLVCVLEMAISGNYGCEIDIHCAAQYKHGDAKGR